MYSVHFSQAKVYDAYLVNFVKTYPSANQDVYKKRCIPWFRNKAVNNKINFKIVAIIFIFLNFSLIMFIISQILKYKNNLIDFSNRWSSNIRYSLNNIDDMTWHRLFPSVYSQKANNERLAGKQSLTSYVKPFQIFL